MGRALAIAPKAQSLLIYQKGLALDTEGGKGKIS
jgi:hypothetical protein